MKYLVTRSARFEGESMHILCVSQWSRRLINERKLVSAIDGADIKDNVIGGFILLKNSKLTQDLEFFTHN